MVIVDVCSIVEHWFQSVLNRSCMWSDVAEREGIFNAIP